MPLYLYHCRTCELEFEELHLLGQAPAQSIRCPLCGGYFERAMARFNIGKRAQPAGQTNPAAASPAVGGAATIDDFGEAGVTHGVDCVCCAPRRR